MSLVYLAGPIDQVSEFGGVGLLRGRAVEELKSVGMVAYDPSCAFHVGSTAKPDGAIYRVNYQALRQADGMLALLPEGVPTIGTPMEVEQAISLFGIPVAVVGGAGWQLAAQRGSVARFDEVGDAVDWLRGEMAARPERSARRVDPMRVAGEGRTPERHYEGDAGFDLYVSQRCTIEAGDFVDVPCGIRVQVPEHVWCMLVGRSSTLRKRGLLVYQGIIDQGYRGELYAGVLNTSGRQQIVEEGERIAQMIPMPLISRSLAPVRVAELDVSDRGANGFGSSGT